jgi:hypothetical protein
MLDELTSGAWFPWESAENTADTAQEMMDQMISFAVIMALVITILVLSTLLIFGKLNIGPRPLSMAIGAIGFVAVILILTGVIIL